jgi:uncharacterized protein (DUF433 family)
MNSKEDQAMQLEDYFEFEKFDTPHGLAERIRLKGHRIAIEHVLNPYIQGDSPERILQNYRHSLSLEQVYATITYYLHNKAQVEAYLKQGRELEAAAYQDFRKREPPEIVSRMRALAAERDETRTGS